MKTQHMCDHKPCGNFIPFNSKGLLRRNIYTSLKLNDRPVIIQIVQTLIG